MQVKVSQDFNRNVQAANGEINKQIDKLKQQLDKGQISQSEYDRKVSNWQQGSVLLNSIAAGLGAPTDSVAGIATATLAPAVSYQIGQAFKKSNEEGSLKHILAHAIVGAVVAQSGGNNALAGALSAGGAEALAPKVAEYLYGKKGSELNAEQKETVSSIMSLAGAATGAIIGNSATNAVQGSLNAENAVENNNAMNRPDGLTPDERIQKDFLSSCTKAISQQECQKRFEQNKRENTKAIISFIADFVPVIGDIKGFAEAETNGDKLFAAIAIFPIVGDGAKKIHDAHKVYEAAKAAKDVEKMKSAMQDAVKGSDLPYNSQQIRAELERRYGAENVVSTTVPKKPVQSVNNQDTPTYTSTVNTNLSGKSVNVKYKDPVSNKNIDVTIPYDNRGLPIFDNVSKFTSKLDTSLSYTAQMRAATRDLWDAIQQGTIPKTQFTEAQLQDIKAGKSKIRGYTWHHNAQSSPHNMQLLPQSVHDAVKHTGQGSLKKGI